MRRLTESLVTLSRFDGNDLILRAEVDLTQVARSVMDRLTPVPQTKGVQRRGDFAPALSSATPSAYRKSLRICSQTP